MIKRLFEVLLTTFFFGLIIQILLMIYGIDFPITLIFGPILYLAFLNQLGFGIKFKSAFIHFVPFLFVTILFFILNRTVLGVYNHIYFISTLISMLIYPSIVIFSKRKNVPNFDEKNLLLLEVIAILGFAIFFFIAIIYINHITHSFSNIKIQFVIVAIILINVSVLTWFLLTNRLSVKMITDNSSHQNQYAMITPIKDKDTIDLSNNIDSLMNNDKLFLDAHLSIDKLAMQLGIPKERVLFYLNHVLHTNFEDWIASYRINYSLELIHLNSENLKLEYLANLSGFDSRTSFNRYFKYYIGESPSTYRSKLLK